MKFSNTNKILMQVCVVVVCLGVSTCFLGCSVKPNNATDNHVKVINENYPTEIIVYGDIVEFDDGFVARTIDKISTENLTSDEKYMFSVLVINDLEGNAPVSDEEMKIITQMIDEEDMNFYYFGTNLLGPLKENGFYTDTLLPSDMFVARVHEPLEVITIIGMWDTQSNELYHTKNSKLLGQRLIRSIVRDIIKMNV
jgi:hypothetical protein